MAVVQNDSAPESVPIPPIVQAMLNQYTNVFSEPKTRPPSREYDHAITLKLDAVSFNVRPYRYSLEYKNEIEKQIKQMLADGIISPSMSPFASPVLLVLKKDGS
jgi:hypothetical protein